MASFIEIETHGGDPIVFKDTRLIPFAQAVRIRIPGLAGGMIWNRPVSVLVVAPDGQEQVIPVRDITRQVVWALFGAALFTWLIFRKVRNHN